MFLEEQIFKMCLLSSDDLKSLYTRYKILEENIFQNFSAIYLGLSQIYEKRDINKALLMV